MIESLPRREREIFETLCRLGEGTATEIREAMDDAPSHSAVRTMLSRLEAKGAITHRVEDQAYVYRSVPQAAKVRDSALSQVVKNFFGGSAVSAATALLGLTKQMDADELDALQKAIDQAKERQQ